MHALVDVGSSRVVSRRCAGRSGPGAGRAARGADPEIHRRLNKVTPPAPPRPTRHRPDLVILDELPPFVWRGPKAFHSLAGRSRGRCEEARHYRSVGGDRRADAHRDERHQAYVIVPAVYTFKLKGVAMRASAQMTFALKKDAGAWLIHGWTWTGPSRSRPSSRPRSRRTDAAPRQARRLSRYARDDRRCRARRPRRRG